MRDLPLQYLARPENPKAHFEVHPFSRVPKEMARFNAWFNETAPCEKQEIRQPVVPSPAAHLDIVSIHPFEDGKGRIRRLLSKNPLSKRIERPVLISLSRTKEAHRKQY